MLGLSEKFQRMNADEHELLGVYIDFMKNTGTRADTSRLARDLDLDQEVYKYQKSKTDIKQAYSKVSTGMNAKHKSQSDFTLSVSQLLKKALYNGLETKKALADVVECRVSDLNAIIKAASFVPACTPKERKKSSLSL